MSYGNLLAQDFESYLEDYAEVLGEDDLSHLYDELLFLWENPIDLNHCKEEDLQELFMLTPQEKEALLDYLRRYRPLDAVAELLLVKGWTALSLQKVRAFVCVSEADKAEDRHHTPNIGAWQVKQKLNYRIGEGVRDSAYRGSILSHSYQLSYRQHQHLRAAFCFDKDEGEVWGDHSGGYVEIGKYKALQQLILGDYRAYFGQGLVFSGALFGGKSHAGTSLLNRNKVFRAQNSYAESNYLRGIAALVDAPALPSAKKASVAISAAWQRIDCNLKDSVFSSIKTDGMHAYEKDMNKRKNVWQLTSALRYESMHEQFQWALNGLFYHFSHAWMPEWQAYNSYYFRGKVGANFSVDWRWRWKQCFLGGEYALDHNGQKAFIMHLNAKPHGDVNLFASLRRFQRAYQAPFAMTFSEKSMVSNEEGLFLSADFRMLRHCIVRCYVDAYRFPWLRYGVSAPSVGWDAQIESEWTLNKMFSIKWRHKTKQLQKNVAADLSGVGVRPLQTLCTQSGRVQLMMTSEEFRIQSSLLYATSEKKRACCFSQELRYQQRNSRLSCFLQHAVFDGNHGLSTYLYSNDLAGGMPFVNLSGKGQMTSLMLKYQCSKFCQWQLRVRHQAYHEKNALTSLGMLLTFKF